MKIFAVKIKDVKDEEMNYLCNFLSEDKKGKIYRYKQRADKSRALIGEILIRNVLCSEYRMKSNELRILKNEYEKPYLDGHSNIHFNISHSGEYVVCAIDDQPVGIDIEQIRPIEYVLLMEDYFSEDEMTSITEENKDRQLSRFYEIWTLKESCIKAEGGGLSIPLKSFSTIADASGGIEHISLLRGVVYCLRTIEFDEQYKLSICSPKEWNIQPIQWIDQEGLFETFIANIVKEEEC